MPFRISALPVAPFAQFFGQDEATLRAAGVERIVVDQCPGFPCRVSLADAPVGAVVLLLNYEHQPAPTPYRASHAVFVQEGAKQALVQPDQVPDSLRRRLLSLRAFDGHGMMVDADVVQGDGLEPVVERMLANTAVDYLHVHHAKQGCYGARIDRS